MLIGSGRSVANVGLLHRLRAIAAQFILGFDE